MRVAAIRARALALMLLGALLGWRVDQADQAELGRAVVGLPEVAEQAAGRGGDHDAAVALLAEVRPGGPDDVVAAVEVDLEHRIPVLERHLVECAVPQDSGVAHDTVDLAELVQGGLDDVLGALGFGHAVVVGHRAAPGVLDLRDHLVGHRMAGAGAVARPPRSFTTTLAPSRASVGRTRGPDHLRRR
jgi:hypothetical protein